MARIARGLASAALAWPFSKVVRRLKGLTLLGSTRRKAARPASPATAVTSLSAFVAIALAVVLTFAAPVAAAPTADWDHVDRVVVFGDLHGDYGKFHDMLVEAGLVDSHDNWSGGRTHLVQVGDVPDRAPDTRKILDLLMRLEPQARRAGGYVHALIGDHEAMNMEGDLRYTTPGEFAAFADPDSPRRRDAYYERVVAYLKAHPPPEGIPTFDAAYRATFDAEHPLGWVEHQIAWSAEGVYGQWVLTHRAVIRINDVLYMHGGLGPSFASYDKAVMNRAVVAALRHEPEPPGAPHDILWAEEGPLWYRGFAQHAEASEAPNVSAVLAAANVNRVVVGHTKQYPYVNARFDGRVILTDIAPPLGCPEPHAFLIEQGDALTAVHRGVAVPLGVSGQAQADYLSRIVDIDRAAGCSITSIAPAAPAAPSGSNGSGR